MGRKISVLCLTVFFLSMVFPLHSLTVILESPRMRLSFFGHPSYWHRVEGQAMVSYGRAFDPPRINIPEGTEIPVTDKYSFELQETDISKHHLALYTRLPLVYHPGGRTSLMGGAHFYGEALETYMIGLSQTLEQDSFEITGFIGGGFSRYTVSSSKEITDDGVKILGKTFNDGDTAKGSIITWSKPALWWGGDVSYAFSEAASLTVMMAKTGSAVFESGAFRMGDRRKLGDFTEKGEIGSNYLLSLGIFFRL